MAHFFFFFFSSKKQLKGKSVEKMQLRFDDLLERHYNNATRLELEQVCWFLVVVWLVVC